MFSSRIKLISSTFSLAALATIFLPLQAQAMEISVAKLMAMDAGYEASQMMPYADYTVGTRLFDQIPSQHLDVHDVLHGQRLLNADNTGGAGSLLAPVSAYNDRSVQSVIDYPLMQMVDNTGGAGDLLIK